VTLWRPSDHHHDHSSNGESQLRRGADLACRGTIHARGAEVVDIKGIAGIYRITCEIKSFRTSGPMRIAVPRTAPSVGGCHRPELQFNEARLACQFGSPSGQLSAADPGAII
jgi:hypothetical protein